MSADGTSPVARSYVDWAGRRVEVDPSVVATLEPLVGAPAPPVAHTGVGLPPAPRCWGWQIQLYALHSATSWGIGDYRDLRTFAVAAAGHGAGLVLVNPLHASSPVHPVERSPYSPTSRRYLDPLALSVVDLPEHADAAADVRARVDALRPPATELIDRDAVWRAKRAALELLCPADPVDADEDLRDFALWCALAEDLGPRWQDWPAGLAARTDLAAAQDAYADRVAFWCWVQRRCEQQATAAHEAAVAAGMRVGVVHDLAVGVDPDGADAWLLQDVLASTCTVGAPPDSFNQQGQDWRLPPWRPGDLARAGYAPLRAMVDAVVRRGGGLRIDHVMGLFRLWWIPPDSTPDRGSYVGYDGAAMLDVVCGVAAEHGAIVVGEDLGTVEPEVRRALADRGVLGSAVLWFEKVDDEAAGPPKAPADWRAQAMASISTHDLPTAAGFLTGEQVRVRADLGLLGRSREQEQADADHERRQLLGALGLPETTAVDDVVVAMHAYLGATPSAIVLASPYDVVGETRQPNLPGTTDAYPNWSIPLPLTLEELLADPRVAAVAEVLSAARP